MMAVVRREGAVFMHSDDLRGRGRRWHRSVRHGHDHEAQLVLALGSCVSAHARLDVAYHQRSVSPSVHVQSTCLYAMRIGPVKQIKYLLTSTPLSIAST
jgi:hypothetical protein